MTGSTVAKLMSVKKFPKVSEMMTNTTRYPTVLYAQDKKHIFLTIDLQDIGDHQLKTTSDLIEFDTEKDNIHYHFNIELFDKVKADTWHTHITNRHAELVVEKENVNTSYWPRLYKQKGKLSFVKTDFAKWKDEDDVDDEVPEVSAQDRMNEELMMRMMQSGDMPNLDFSQTQGEPDSDDEEEVPPEEK